MIQSKRGFKEAISAATLDASAVLSQLKNVLREVYIKITCIFNYFCSCSGGYGLVSFQASAAVSLLRVHLREWRDRDTPHGAFVARHSQHTQPVIQ